MVASRSADMRAFSPLLAAKVLGVPNPVTHGRGAYGEDK
jgi:hypothetical protein